MPNRIEITTPADGLYVDIDDDGDVFITRENYPDSDIIIVLIGEEVDKLIHAIEQLRKNQKEASNVN